MTFPEPRLAKRALAALCLTGFVCLALYPLGIPAADLNWDNRNAKAHGNLGLIYIEKKLYQQSKKHFQRALEINPSDEMAREKIRALERNGF